MRIVFVLLMGLILSRASIAQQDSSNYQKGVARANAGNLDDALVFFSAAVDENPADPFAWYNRGITKTFMELHREAIGDFNKAIELQPGYHKAYLNRGISRRKLLDFDGAHTDYKLAIAASPNYAEAFYHRGYVFELLGNKDSACYFYSIAAAFGLKQIQDKMDICQKKSAEFDKHIIQLTKSSSSKTYGFSKEDPIKVGGSPLNQREYLMLLRDANGKPVRFERAGSCCGYKLKSAPLGMAMLDRYMIYYKDENGQEQKAGVFMTFYEYEEPMLLHGFKTIAKP